MNIQIVFYWIASIVFVLVGIFVIVGISVMLFIRAKVASAARAAESLAHEATMMVESAKSRVRGMGAGMAASAISMILKMIKASRD